MDTQCKFIKMKTVAIWLRTDCKFIDEFTRKSHRKYIK